MVFLDFEKPLEKLYEQLEKIKQVEEEGAVDMSAVSYTHLTLPTKA